MAPRSNDEMAKLLMELNDWFNARNVDTLDSLTLASAFVTGQLQLHPGWRKPWMMHFNLVVSRMK